MKILSLIVSFSLLLQTVAVAAPGPSMNQLNLQYKEIRTKATSELTKEAVAIYQDILSGKKPLATLKEFNLTNIQWEEFEKVFQTDVNEIRKLQLEVKENTFTLKADGKSIKVSLEDFFEGYIHINKKKFDVGDLKSLSDVEKAIKGKKLLSYILEVMSPVQSAYAVFPIIIAAAAITAIYMSAQTYRKTHPEVMKEYAHFRDTLVKTVVQCETDKQLLLQHKIEKPISTQTSQLIRHIQKMDEWTRKRDVEPFLSRVRCSELVNRLAKNQGPLSRGMSWISSFFGDQFKDICDSAHAYGQCLKEYKSIAARKRAINQGERDEQKSVFPSVPVRRPAKKAAQQ